MERRVHDEAVPPSKLKQGKMQSEKYEVQNDVHASTLHFVFCTELYLSHRNKILNRKPIP